MANKNLFEKAAELLKDLQNEQGWQEKPDDNMTQCKEIALAKYAANQDEAAMLCKIASMALLNVENQYHLNGFGTGIYLNKKKEDSVEPHSLAAECILYFDSDEGEDGVEASKRHFSDFTKDNSLHLEQQPRVMGMTAEFEPKNLKQALDFAKWKESARWAQAKNDAGFYYALCESHGLPHGMMFYGKHQVDNVNRHFQAVEMAEKPAPPRNWVVAAEENMRYPDIRNIPQIWKNSDNELLVLAQHAKAILVDFLGLDGKILGLEQRARVS